MRPRTAESALTLPSQSKAVHYIDQLDNARCIGDWKAVPELVRKIRKHAPERSCATPPQSIAIVGNPCRLTLFLLSRSDSDGRDRVRHIRGHVPNSRRHLERPTRIRSHDD